jgi:cation:H+ antiporter
VSSLPIWVLVAMFVAAAAAIWVAGVQLSNTTDVLDARLHLGAAAGGILLLAVATNLPEIAITITAAVSGSIGVAIGNILGGIAIQTVVLVALDAFGMKVRRPLTFQAASLTLVLEAMLVIAVLVIAVMGSQLPAHLYWARLSPSSVLIAVVWLTGVLLLNRTSGRLPWQDAGEAPDNQGKPKGHAQQAKSDQASKRQQSTKRAALIFAAAAVVTLVAGVVLERSGDALATHVHLTGVLFGATVLAAATSLPELSTGITSVRLGDYQLAMSDIFGGNAFLPVLFVLADLLSGKAVLPQAQHTDIYLTGLGALLTGVYAAGLVLRPRRNIARLGLDSLAVLVLYLVGITGLVALATS